MVEDSIENYAVTSNSTGPKQEKGSSGKRLTGQTVRFASASTPGPRSALQGATGAALPAGGKSTLLPGAL
ncbi:hypothetical protein WJX81_000696 [Elliptochloris bilobata]|uniref:Uncharacterized protein n=1 Tax=Elliptochloris bilobata TaxID=381761 RepID=A0AAW1QGR5_9CHLO